MRVMICICSKYPNHQLPVCIRELYKHQISQHTYEIHVVDSDSDNMMYYDEVTKKFPEVRMHMIKNKNYEYGAWTYIVNLYPNYDVYFCIQDTIILQQPIHLDQITAYTFHNFSGYNRHLSIKPLGINILSRCQLSKDKVNIQQIGSSYLTSIEDKNFNLAQHCSFIVNNHTMKNMFIELSIPPTNKDESCCYERIFGLYFLSKGIKTIDLHKYMNKIHGDRY